MKPRLLLIEDDPQIRRFLRTALGENGYEVFEAETAQRGLAEAAARRPDVILLDLGLPDMDGLEVVKRLRSWTTTPIVVVSARGQEDAKVAALDLGADDYLVKPFGIAELLARIRTAWRHANRSASSQATVSGHGVVIDLDHRVVTRGDAEVHLTPTEFRLLSELARHAGKVLTHRHLLREIWGPSHAEDSHYLRIYMAQLRSKLEQDANDPQLLLTEQAVGYRLDADS
jgi:two-component system, OmpR family, KDP operon response regulator KdpE